MNQAFGYLVRRGVMANLARAREHGAATTLKRLRAIIRASMELRSAAAFDQRYGVDTRGQLAVRDLDIHGRSASLAYGFGSIPVVGFRRALRSLGLIFEDFSFIDFGCGKGRALILAAEFRFCQVIGVEHAADLAAIAERNIASLAARDMACSDIVCRLSDAAQFDPPDQPCLLFFYTPFHDALLRQVLDRVKASFDLQPRRLVLLFARQRIEGGPRIDRAVADFDFLRPMKGYAPPTDWATFPPIDYLAFEARLDRSRIIAPRSLGMR